MSLNELIKSSLPKKLVITSAGKFFGINDSNNQIVLHPIYDEVSVLIYKNGEFEGEYGTNIGIWSKIQQRAERSKTPDNLSSKAPMNEIMVENFHEVVFLTKSNEEYHLYKLCVNRTKNKPGVIDLYKEYTSIEVFQLTYPEGKRYYNTDNYVDTVDLGKIYSEIIHIGKGLFKVKIIDVYQLNMPDQQEAFYIGNAIYDRYVWKLIDYKGESKFDKPFTEIDLFNNNLCKVNRGGKWNFINEKGKFQLSNWYPYLEYPLLNDDLFLAGWKSYLISIGKEEGPVMFRTTDFVTKNDDDEPSYSLLNKIDRAKFKEKDLASLFQAMYADKTCSISVNELTRLDLYNREGLVKRLGVSSLRPLYDNLFVAEVHSDFLIDMADFENQKIFRHHETSNAESYLPFDFSFTQIRLVNKEGDFIGDNYYHEIQDFNEKGIAKASKSYFVLSTENNQKYLDTCLNVAYFKGDISFWKDYGGFRDIEKLKYGYIDLNGNEISEFLDEYPEGQ